MGGKPNIPQSQAARNRKAKPRQIGSLDKPSSEQLMTHAEIADGTRSPPFPRPPSQCSARGIGEGRTSTSISRIPLPLRKPQASQAPTFSPSRHLARRTRRQIPKGGRIPSPLPPLKAPSGLGSRKLCRRLAHAMDSCAREQHEAQGVSTASWSISRRLAYDEKELASIAQVDLTTSA
eukprot:scaffold2246_cov105-Isochrysis_galbana.AAC.2